MSTLYRCQIFTPPDKVNKLLNSIDYKQNLFGKKFLENSCGNGSVLIEVVSRYIKDCFKNKYSITKIRQGLQADIWGFEIDKEKYNECIENLNKTAKLFEIDNVNWNIIRADYLEYENLPKFSYIAGNPPYRNYRDLPINIRSYVKNTFNTCNKGKFDYCYAFIEKSINDLDEEGRLAYLIPSSIFKNVFAKNLRNFILPHITEIYDFKTEKVFDKALVATSILVCKKNSNKSCLKYKNEENNKLNKIEKKQLGNKWLFNNQNANGNCKFGDHFRASISIATLLNNAFVLDENTSINIESEVTKPAKSPRNLAYSKKEKIIFPYFYENDTLKRYSEDDFKNKFPKAIAYLERKKEALNKRNKDVSAKWFEYGRSQALSHLNQKKLLISTVITDSIKVYELGKEDIPYAGIYITSLNGTPLDKAKEILTSNSFLEYVNNIGIQASGTSLRITPKDINNFEFDIEEI